MCSHEEFGYARLLLMYVCLYAQENPRMSVHVFSSSLHFFWRMPPNPCFMRKWNANIIMCHIL